MGRRKKKPEEHENLERWLVSYADFITLLFAFFTTMYAISSVDAQKMGRMVLSMQAAFSSAIFPASNSKIGLSNSGAMPPPQSSALFNSVVKNKELSKAQKMLQKLKTQDLVRIKRENLARIKQDLTHIIMDDALKDKVKIVIKSRGIVVSLAEAGFFDSGKAVVKKDSLPLLDKIANYLKGLPNFIRVEGHTDNVPIHTSRFPSNWELSTARATYIVSYFIRNHGFDPRKLSAAGYGEYHPIDTNSTTEGRAKNRRVDIVILTSKAMLQEPDSVVSEGAKKILEGK